MIFHIRLQCPSIVEEKRIPGILTSFILTLNRCYVKPIIEPFYFHTIFCITLHVYPYISDKKYKVNQHGSTDFCLSCYRA